MNRFGLAASTALAVLVAFSGFAGAQDLDAFLERFKASMSENGSTVSWASADQYDSSSGDPSVMLNDTVFTSGEGSATVAQIELVNVTEDEDGWHIGSLWVPLFSRTQDGTTVEVSDIRMAGIVIAPEGQENAYGGTMLYDTASLVELRVVKNNIDMFTLADFHVELSAPDDGSAMEFSGAAEAFTANLGAIDDPKSKAIIAALGYGSLSGYFEMEGSWNPDDGLFELARYDISVENAGTFGISLELGGYTREFVASMRKSQAKLAANPGANAAEGMATLDRVKKQLTFNSARIQFDDDTLTNKILEFVAKQQGSRARDVAAQAKIMVPFMAMQFGTPEIAAMVSAAAAAYLDNPQSLTIAAEPAQPIGFEEIIEGAMMEPQTLPNVLGLKITANE